VFLNSIFHVYDPILQKGVEQLNLAWARALNHGNEYNSTIDVGTFIFHNPLDLPLPREEATSGLG
jgi:hypothetical protein